MTRGARASILGALLALGCKTTATTPLSHRPSDVACTLGPPVSTAPCDASADCPSAPRSVCRAYDDAGVARFCNADTCQVDTDCADGGVCLCGAAVTSTAIATPNTCLAAGNCRVDSDCSPGHFCGPSSVGCGTTFAYYCHTPGDDCGNDSDCRENQLCQYSPAARKWSCVSAGACAAGP